MSQEKNAQPEIERQTMPLWPDFGQAIGIGRNVAYERAGKDFRIIRIGKRILVPRVELERLLSGK